MENNEGRLMEKLGIGHSGQFGIYPKLSKYLINRFVICLKRVDYGHGEKQDRDIL